MSDELEIARLRLALAQVESAQRLARLDATRITWQVGDRVRVLRRDAQGAEHIGDVGTVVAVTSPPHAAGIVHPNAIHQVVLLDFGPDPERYQGRDTWSYADADLARPEVVVKGRRRKP